MTAERNPIVRRTADGSFSLLIEIDFVYGDLVQYDSINGTGRGTVESVIVPEDGGVYYTIMVADGPAEDYHSGIYPDEMKLLERRCACGAYGTHSCTGPEQRTFLGGLDDEACSGCGTRWSHVHSKPEKEGSS